MCLIQLYATSPPSKNIFSKATKGASFGRSFAARKNSFFQSGLSTSIWGKKTMALANSISIAMTITNSK